VCSQLLLPAGANLEETLQLTKEKEPIRCKAEKLLILPSTGQILALKDIAGENSSREGVHHGDHIKGAFDLRNAMFFDVANIDAPSLMARSRFEWVGLWSGWLFWGGLIP
jgi:hypothetical protein